MPDDSSPPSHEDDPGAEHAGSRTYAAATAGEEAVEIERLVARTAGLQPWRRIFHVGNGLVLAWLPVALELSRTTVVAVLGAVLCVLVAADVVRLRIPRLNAFFYQTFPSFASPREAERLASSTWYLLGVMLAYALFPMRIAVLAVLVLAVADPAASVLGRLLGRRRLGKGSVEGSLAFLAVATGILGPNVGWAAALAVALGVALVEVVPWGLDDNLTVPVAAAVLLWMVGV